MHKRFQVLTPHWLNRAHMYNGSIGPFGNDFRYQMKMDKDSGVVHAAAYSRWCKEKADDVVARDFPWDDDGIEALKQWLQAMYESFLENGSVKE